MNDATSGPTVRVRDVMTTNLHTVDGLATVADAMRLMRRHAVSSLVVERRDDDDEMGLVDVVHIANEVIARNRAPERVSVYELMSKPVVTVPSDMLTRYAARLLGNLRLSRAVVVDETRNAVGMVTLRDIVLVEVGEDRQRMQGG